MIKAIIFDMDGVIADTDRTRFELFKILLQKRGLQLNDKEYIKSVGKRTKKFLAEMFPAELTVEDIDQIYKERKVELYKDPKKYVIAQPYVRECCKKLFNLKYTLAIASVSDKKNIEMVLKQVGIRKYFSYITSGDDVLHMKPNPEIYLKSIEKVGLEKKYCVAIEDSPTGISSAKSAGIKSIGVTYTHSSSDLEEADFIIDNLSEVEEIIKNI